MQTARGDRQLKVALVDGPVAIEDPAFAGARLTEIPGNRGACELADSVACRHGTFVAGILCAGRASGAPAICPDCTLLVRPIFAESPRADGGMPSATPDELAEAVLDCLDAGARVINVSATIPRASLRTEQALEEALDRAAARGVIVVVAAGNQGALGSTAITRHPWVIPVVAYDLNGRPMAGSNLGRSIGRMGIGAPGSGVTSLGTDGRPHTLDGTSAAAPFVTGTIGLLWSAFPSVSAAEMRSAVTRPFSRLNNTVVPPLLDAWRSYQELVAASVQEAFA